jgi:hypothetical protein
MRRPFRHACVIVTVPFTLIVVGLTSGSFTMADPPAVADPIDVGRKNKLELKLLPSAENGTQVRIEGIELLINYSLPVDA